MTALKKIWTYKIMWNPTWNNKYDFFFFWLTRGGTGLDWKIETEMDKKTKKYHLFTLDFDCCSINL